MAWEKHDPEPEKHKGGYTLYRQGYQGHIYISSGMVKALKIDNYKRAELLHDEEKQLIAIRLTKTYDIDNVPIHRQGGTGMISNNAFVKMAAVRYGYPPSQMLPYKIEKDIIILLKRSKA